MIRLWGKIMIDNKIVKEYDYKVEGDNLTTDNLQSHLVELCYSLDLETPVLLKKHYKHYNEFSSIKFLPSDFI